MHRSLNCCTIIIAAYAPTINMTKIPLDVKEGSVVDYVCETDYAFADPPVLWFMDDEPVDANYVHTEEHYSSPVAYHGQMTKSTLTLKIKRDMNNKTVKCVLRNSSTNLSKHVLNVMCKHPLIYISKVFVKRFYF